jgi:hypothetical protein
MRLSDEVSDGVLKDVFCVSDAMPWIPISMNEKKRMNRKSREGKFESEKEWN